VTVVPIAFDLVGGIQLASRALHRLISVSPGCHHGRSVPTIDKLFAKANVLSVIWSQEDPGNDPIEGA
jgi:hypothetical protein